LYFALLIFSLIFVLISLATARVLLPCRQAIQLISTADRCFIREQWITYDTYLFDVIVCNRGDLLFQINFIPEFLQSLTAVSCCYCAGTHEYMSPMSSSEGVRVVIHPPDTEPYPHTEGFDVPPGYSATFGVKVRRIVCADSHSQHCDHLRRGFL